MMTNSPSSTAKRYAQIAGLLWKYRNARIFSSDFDALKTDDLEQEANSSSNDLPEQFVADLENLGPTFIKLGQSLSTRPDMVPPEYVQALKRIQDDVEALDFETVRDVIEQQLQVNLDTAFGSFDREPLAAASLGQVHRATLRDGRPVAVKVQRPNVRQQIAIDLDVLQNIADKVGAHSKAGRVWGVAEWVVELRRTLTRELDYVREGENLRRMAEIVEDYDALIVPQPVADYTKTRVLTMEYVRGTKIESTSPLRRLEGNWERLGEQLTKAYLDQYFVHGFIHADPHPGNVLLTEDDRLVILDLGMVTHLSPRMRDRMLNLLLSVTDGRGEDVAERLIELGTPLRDFDRDGLVRSVSKLIASFDSRQKEKGEGRLLLDLNQAAAEHCLQPPPETILLGKTMLNLETLSRSLSPDIQLGEVVQSHLEKLMRHRMLQQFTPQSVAAHLMETHKAISGIPRQISQILGLLASNAFKINVEAIDENRFAQSLQKIANRVTIGLIIAALIVGAALLMRVETEATLFGYPAFAMVCFLLAGSLGFFLVGSVLWNDFRSRRDRSD